MRKDEREKRRGEGVRGERGKEREGERNLQKDL